MFRVIEDAAEEVTIEICQMYHEIGFECIWNDGKDLTIKEKDLSDCRLKRSRY